MKNSFNFISLFLLLIFNFQNINAQIKSKRQNNLLAPFTVTYKSWGEFNMTYRMNIYKKNNEYYAENITPFFYYGNKTDSTWSVKLNKQQISICEKFIKIAHSLNKNCQNLSSLSEYQILTGIDTLEIARDCDWKSLDYFSLQKILFKSKFIDLEKKRSNIVDSLNKKIRGKWYYEPLKNKPKKGDIIKLTKVKSNETDCYWEFSKNYFKSSCNNIMDFTYTQDYEWYIDGIISLNISAGIITDKDGSSTVGNFDQSFNLKLLNEKELELEFSYVY